MSVYEVTIEEHVSKTFDVEAQTLEDAEEIARQKYYNGEFVVGENVTYRCMETVDKETGYGTQWVEL